MTQKERLVELLFNAPNEDGYGCTSVELADYLLSNGVIVPPCKVGDTVYDIGGFSKIMKAEVETITTDGQEMSSVVVNPQKPYIRWFVNLKNINKTVFSHPRRSRTSIKGAKKMRYRLQRKTPYSMPNIIGNCSYPLPTYRWKDIAASDDLNQLIEIMQNMVPRENYRIEDTRPNEGA